MSSRFITTDAGIMHTYNHDTTFLVVITIDVTIPLHCSSINVTVPQESHGKQRDEPLGLL